MFHKHEVKIWTVVGLINTVFDILINNETDIRRVLLNMSDIREQAHSSFFFDFCTIRLYLLVYIVLLYPVFVDVYEISRAGCLWDVVEMSLGCPMDYFVLSGQRLSLIDKKSFVECNIKVPSLSPAALNYVVKGKQKMLIAPWLVVCGLRMLAPGGLFRIYFWILIFRYWLYLIDKEVRKCKKEACIEKKKKYLQSKDEDEMDLIRELRWRVKGLRSFMAMRTLSTTSVIVSTESIVQFDCYENDLNNESNISSVLEINISSTSEEYKKSNQELSQINKYMTRHSFLDKSGAVRVTDCILQQITDLIQVLVTRPKAELLKECREAEKEIASWEKSDSSEYAPVFSGDVMIKVLRYPKPRYVEDFPKIFARSRRMSDEYVINRRLANKFGRMLIKTTGSEDTLRDTLEDFFG